MAFECAGAPRHRFGYSTVRSSASGHPNRLSRCQVWVARCCAGRRRRPAGMLRKAVTLANSESSGQVAGLGYTCRPFAVPNDWQLSGRVSVKRRVPGAWISS